MRGRKDHGLRGLRTRSKPEAIEAREQASVPLARSADFGQARNVGPMAEILELQPEPPMVLGRKTVIIMAALAVAIVYLLTMLVIAALSPTMYWH